MRTMVITIDDPDCNGAGYPVSLRSVDPETGQFAAEEAHGIIPFSLPAIASGGEGEGEGKDALEWMASVLQASGMPRDPNGLDVDQEEIEQLHIARLHSIGRYLRELMNDGGVWATWSRICADQENGDGEECTRTYIDVRPADLRKLPWELTVDNADDATFLVRRHQIMRGHPIQERNGVHDVFPPPPIRVLVVVCDEDEEYLAQDEVDSIYASVCQPPGIWQVEVLRQPTWEHIRDKLEDFPPHVFHFIAHTGSTQPLSFNVKRSSQEDGDATDWALTVDRIADLLVPMEVRPSLLILNACQTAHTASAERFHRLGVRAAVTTHAPINSPAAVCFTRAFYQRLARNGCVGDAMWHARSQMHLRRQEDDFDWWIPVLTVCGSPDNVIGCDLPVLGERAVNLMQTGQYDRVELFVDRIVSQQRIWRNVCGEMNDLDKRKLILISGKASAGKTQLIRSCMLSWRLHERPGALVSMQGVPGSGKLGTTLVLIQICQALLAQSELSDAIRDDLNGFIDRVREIKQDSPGNGESNIPNDKANSPYDGACDELRKILLKVAAGRPLLLALDQVDDIFEYDFFGPIYQKLLLPVARDRFGPIHVIFAFRENGSLAEVIAKGKDMDKVSAWDYCVQTITIDFFTEQDAVPLGREFGARAGWIDADWQKLLELNPEFAEPWAPAELQKLAGPWGQKLLQLERNRAARGCR
jgi:CHAT domain